MAGGFTIAEWSVEPQLNSLERDGQTVRLEPKVMHVLVCLANHPGELVSKEQLIGVVWADTFVTDEVLTRCIHELRKALNDDPKQPRFIETIPKGGYRLLPPVQSLERVSCHERQPAAENTIQDAHVIRFAAFEVDLRCRELRKSGVRLKLSDHPFQVLAILLEQPGQVVTREELQKRLWPDTFVDIDHNLKTAINKIREVLGDTAENPRFVETLPRRGYRFIAPINRSVAPSGIEIAPVTKRDKLFFWVRWVAALCLALILVAVVVWLALRPQFRRTDIAERRLTWNSSENWVVGASISPDGKYLAYSDNTGIYLKLIRTGETHSLQLPSSFLAHVNDWFPDGSHLLISREDQPGKTSLWSISVFGGSPRHLADSAAGGSVSPDGNHVAFLRSDLTYDRYGLEVWIMRSDGTDPIKVAGSVTGEADSQFGVPTWSPDGNRIAYIRSNSSSIAAEVNEWQRGRTEIVFSDSRLASALHWLPDGRLAYVLFDQESSHDSSLWTASLQRSGNNSKPPKRIAQGTQGNGWIQQITGTADGKALAFVRVIWTATTFIGTLSPDGKTLIQHHRLTLDESVNIPSSWTPDSRAILFLSDRNGKQEIFEQTIDQPLGEILATSVDQLELPRLTPDGSEILYISTPRSANSDVLSSIFAIPITGGTPRLVLKAMHIWNVQCARLPSTVCLYTIQKGNTSETETFHFDVRNGKSTAPPQIDADGDWSLSADGSQRALISGPDEGTIQLRSTSSDETRSLIIKGWNGLRNIVWSADGKSLLVAWSNQDKESKLLNITPDGTVSVVLSSNRWIGFAVPSPDGRRLAIIEAVNPTKNAWEIQGF